MDSEKVSGQVWDPMSTSRWPRTSSSVAAIVYAFRRRSASLILELSGR